MIFDTWSFIADSISNPRAFSAHLRLCPAKFEFAYGHTCFTQILKETELFWSPYKQRISFCAFSTRRSTNTMNVFFWFVRRIILNYPVNLLYVETSSGNIRTQQNTRRCWAILKNCCSSFCLLLPAMHRHVRQINVVQQFVVKFNRHA